MGVWEKEVLQASRRHGLKTLQSIFGTRVMTVSLHIHVHDILLGAIFVCYMKLGGVRN